MIVEEIQKYVLGLLRISMGSILLWAFFDKLFGLEFATMHNKSWLAGNSPTSGFLLNATHGPFAEFFKSLAGSGWVDWIFMLGLFLIGLSLLFGIFMKLAGYSGTLMFLLMWLALLPPENNPIFDEHIIYSLVLILLSSFKAGKYLGYSNLWIKTKLVRRYPFLE